MCLVLFCFALLLHCSEIQIQIQIEGAIWWEYLVILRVRSFVVFILFIIVLMNKKRDELRWDEKLSEWENWIFFLILMKEVPLKICHLLYLIPVSLLYNHFTVTLSIYIFISFFLLLTVWFGCVCAPGNWLLKFKKKFNKFHVHKQCVRTYISIKSSKLIP